MVQSNHFLYHLDLFVAVAESLCYYVVMGKEMPHNIEAEQSAIACVLLDNDVLSAFTRLNEAHFYSPAHKIIFDAIDTLAKKNVAVDLVTLTERLSAANKLEAVGGMQYLSILTDIVPSAANFKHYIAILKKNETLRRLVSASSQIIKEAAAADDEQNVLKTAEKLIYDIGRAEEKKEMTLLSAELPAVLETLDLAAHDPAALRGLRTGYYQLDDITNGLQKSDLIIIAARPGVGKTSLALNIILNAALRNKSKCAIFSLEMSKRQLTTRALCSVARVSLTKAVKGELSATEWSRLWAANKKLSAANIYIDDNSTVTHNEILRKCQRLQREQGLDLVMVDYLGLMGASSSTARFENRQNIVAENSRAMKILAKELDIPVLLLSQLNRQIETETRRGRNDVEPVLSDLRESGAIEQDADIVLFIHKPKAEANEGIQAERQTSYTAKIKIEKHRNGETGHFPLYYHSEYTTFENPTGGIKAEKQPGDDLPNVSTPLPEIMPVQDSSVSDIW
jgi:replicative DNA helicase